MDAIVVINRASHAKHLHLKQGKVNRKHSVQVESPREQVEWVGKLRVAILHRVVGLPGPTRREGQVQSAENSVACVCSSSEETMVIGTEGKWDE